MLELRTAENLGYPSYYRRLWRKDEAEETPDDIKEAIKTLRVLNYAGVSYLVIIQWIDGSLLHEPTMTMGYKWEMERGWKRSGEGK